MSKCKPGTGPKLQPLLQHGVVLEDVTTTSAATGTPERHIVIRIPHEALVSNPAVQTAFQDYVTISTTE
jgi:hypothetical protein